MDMVKSKTVLKNGSTAHLSMYIQPGEDENIIVIISTKLVNSSEIVSHVNQGWSLIRKFKSMFLVQNTMAYRENFLLAGLEALSLIEEKQ